MNGEGRRPGWRFLRDRSEMDGRFGRKRKEEDLRMPEGGVNGNSRKANSMI